MTGGWEPPGKSAGLGCDYVLQELGSCLGAGTLEHARIRDSLRRKHCIPLKDVRTCQMFSRLSVLIHVASGFELFLLSVVCWSFLDDG